MQSRRRSTIIQLVGANAILLIGIVQGLLLVPIYISLLGVELYGYWLSLGGLVGLLALADFGVTNLAAQRGATLAGSNDFKGFSRLSGSLAIWNGAASVLILVGGVLAAIVLPNLFSVPTLYCDSLQKALLVAALEVLFLLWTCTAGALLFALQRPTMHMKSMVTSSILGIVVTLTLLQLGWGIVALPLGGCVRALLPLPFNLIALRLELRLQGVCVFGPPSRKIIRQFSLDSLLLAPAQWLETMLAQIDTIMTLHFLGASFVTVLEITKKAAAVAAPFIARVSASFLPGLAHLHGAKEELRFRYIIERLQTATLYAAVIYFGVICVANEPFVSLWTSKALFGGQFLTVLISLVSVIRIFKGLLYNLARARNEVRFTAISSYVEFPLHVIFALLLVGTWGLHGIVWGGLFAGLIGLVIQVKGLSSTSIAALSFLHARTIVCSLLLVFFILFAMVYLPAHIVSWASLAATLALFLVLSGLIILLCDGNFREDMIQFLKQLRA